MAQGTDTVLLLVALPHVSGYLCMSLEAVKRNQVDYDGKNINFCLCALVYPTRAVPARTQAQFLLNTSTHSSELKGACPLKMWPAWRRLQRGQLDSPLFSTCTVDCFEVQPSHPLMLNSTRIWQLKGPVQELLEGAMGKTGGTILAAQHNQNHLANTVWSLR